ncbi:MAG: HEAT repeat domain-containing protein [Pirellulales bacterium]
METRLHEVAVLGNQVREGNTLVLADGPVMVDPTGDEENGDVELRRGRVLGGGFLTQTRPMRLVLKPGHQTVRYSAEIGNALNRRFHTFSDGVKRGIAVPKTESYVQLSLHPRYKDNVERFIEVVRSTALDESPVEEAERIEQLGQLLRDGPTARVAAMRLEAIGKRSCDTLAAALRSRDPEVRFYAAEALAYLDDERAAKPLGALARDEPAFRVFALTALSAMDAYEAHDELRQLLASPSAETRYGAFRALWAMNHGDPLVRGEVLGGRINFHMLDTPAPAMIHVTRSFRPEIVMFGAQQTLRGPFSLQAGGDIMVTSREGGRVSVARLAVGREEKRHEVSAQLDDVIRAVVDVGGTYPDIVDMLIEAEQAKVLSGRFLVDAVPRAGRTYTRVARSDTETVEEDTEADTKNLFPLTSGPALPSLFENPDEAGSKRPAEDVESEEAEESPEKEETESSNPLKRFFVRMKRGGQE